jgi:hypothetical protein
MQWRVETRFADEFVSPGAGFELASRRALTNPIINFLNLGARLA